MPTPTVAVLSLRPLDPTRPDAPDLRDILQALGPRLGDWGWCVKHLDWLGDAAADEFSQRVEAARPGGVWLPSEMLQQYARNVWQTIDGDFYAFPQTVDPGSVNTRNLDAMSFATLPWELAIRAVDGTWFDILAKDPDDLSRVRHLAGARVEDVTDHYL